MTLPVLLYSNFCEHSRNLLKNIGAAGNMDGVLKLTCIDNIMHALPHHIDRIPALVMPSNGGNRVAFGRELQARLSDIIRGEPRETVEPFTTDSDYVFGGMIGDKPGDDDIGLFASPTQEYRIYMQDDGSAPPEMQSGGGGKKSSRTDDEVSRLMSEREADLSKIYGNRAAPQGVGVGGSGGALPPLRQQQQQQQRQQGSQQQRGSRYEEYQHPDGARMTSASAHMGGNGMAMQPQYQPQPAFSF